mgnify:CR=1 FL=1
MDKTAGVSKNPTLRTTEQAFGDQLHAYTIVDAINDKNVLPFRVDYIKTMDMAHDIDDKDVWDINRERAFMAPDRIRLVTEYILDHFDQKTYRGSKTYTYNVLQNIAEVACAKNKDAIEEVKQKVKFLNLCQKLLKIHLKFHQHFLLKKLMLEQLQL